jgi:hypothetical protein
MLLTGTEFMFFGQTSCMHRRRGIALIMVIVTLFILVLIAVPFSVSMRVEKRATGAEFLHTRTRLAAFGAMNYAVTRLAQSCASKERGAQAKPPYDTPDYDAPSEFSVDIRIPELDVANPRGEMWSVLAEDEQGKIDVNSASPWLLGNLMASAILRETARDNDTELLVDSTSHFPPSGHLWIHGELVHYAKLAPDRFLDCRRGLYGDSPRFREAQSWPAGTLVIDARAHRICQHRLAVRPGNFTPFRTVEEIRRIADISDYAIEACLFARIEPMLTVYAQRHNAAGWIHARRLLNDVGSEEEEEKSKATQLTLPDISGYRSGMTIELSEDNKRAYAMIMYMVGNNLLLDSKVAQRFNKDKAVVRVLEAHAININSTPPRVLFSLFKGLRSGDGNWLDAQEAFLLTGAIMGWRQELGGIRSTEHLYQLLQELQRAFRDKDIKNERGEPALSAGNLAAVLCTCYSLGGLPHRFRGMAISPPPLPTHTPWPPLASLLFASHDTYTIEATAVINNSNAVPLADHTMRRVVTVAPLDVLEWRLESQSHFAQQMHYLPSFRVITWPNFTCAGEHLPTTDTKAPGTGISLDTMPLFPRAQPATSLVSYRKWDNHEGVTCPGPEPTPQNILTNNLETAPGALSFWFYALDGDGGTLFDWGDGQWDNRVTCFHEQDNLVLRVCDATLEEAAAEVGAPFDWRVGWHYVMAAWYTTAPGGLFLWIDGQPCGEFAYRVGKQAQKAVLQNNLLPDTPALRLDNCVGLPDEGVIRIGDEAIEYSGISGNIVTVREQYDGFEQEGLRRGARGTTAQKHPAGAAVSLFGYSDPLASNVFPATKLASNIAAETLYCEILPYPAPPLDAASKSIMVTSTAQFPPSGYLLLVDALSNAVEKVHYLKTGPTSFLQCRRGQLGTKAQAFLQAYIVPISIFVDDNTKYEDVGIVQIEDEWLSYASKVDDNVLLFSPSVEAIRGLKTSQKFRPDYRGVMGTMSSRHDEKKSVLPVFRTRFGWGGRGDKVTIIAQNDPAQREEMAIQWATGNYAAFSKDVSRDYTVARGTRLLKFPSGELPLRFREQNWGLSLNAGKRTRFVLDELTWLQRESRPTLLLRAAVDAKQNELPLMNAQGLASYGGLCKIGDEYIAYSKLLPKESLKVQRGFANTRAATHTSGMQVFPVFFLPATTLRSPLAPYAAEAKAEGSSLFPPEGYVRCEEEILSYSQITRQGFSMPADREGRGVLRGAFGTEPSHHATEQLVYFFPVRYPDRAASLYDGTELAYFEAAKTAPCALWERVSWEADNPESQYLGLQVLARVDGRPGWDETPTNAAGGLFLFDDPQGLNKLHVPGNMLELRVMFPYRKGCYAQGWWKAKVLMKSLCVEYRQSICVWESK